MSEFERDRHIKYIVNSLVRYLPKQYSNADSSRLTLVHFCIISLDVLGCLPDYHRHMAASLDDDGGGGGGGGTKTLMICGLVEEEILIPRDAIVEWIYGLVARRIPPSREGGRGGGRRRAMGGFRGGTYLGPIPPTNEDDEDDEDDDEDYPTITPSRGSSNRHPYDHAHLAMTYVALCTLLTLGDDLSRVDKFGIMKTLISLQREDGSFSSISSMTNDGGGRRMSMSGSGPRRRSEDEDGVGTAGATVMEEDDDDDDSDLRFVYTAAAIRYILLTIPTVGDDVDHGKEDEDIIIDFDVESAKSYVLSCRSYDGGLGLTPGREGHGGSTFCGIAALRLLGVLDDVMDGEDGWRMELVRWCVMRQRHTPPRIPGGTRTSGTMIGRDDECHGYGKGKEDGHSHDGAAAASVVPSISTVVAAGMQGRPNKPEDTCYSYWIGGTLNLLSESHLLDGDALRRYVLSCQTPYGGFGKAMGAMPDLLHSFYSMAWLSLSKQGGCCDYHQRTDADENRGDDEDRRGGDMVDRALGRLSELDCALGMCTKRLRRHTIG